MKSAHQVQILSPSTHVVCLEKTGKAAQWVSKTCADNESAGTCHCPAPSKESGRFARFFCAHCRPTIIARLFTDIWSRVGTKSVLFLVLLASCSVKVQGLLLEGTKTRLFEPCFCVRWMKATTTDKKGASADVENTS